MGGGFDLLGDDSPAFMPQKKSDNLWENNNLVNIDNIGTAS